MKTAMQELINEIKESVPYLKMDIYQPNFNKALEKEKEQLLKEYHRGMVDEFNIILNVAKPKPITKTNNL